MSTQRFIGDVLIRAGVIDAPGLARAVESQAGNRCSLGRAIAELGLAEESVVASTIASALRLEYLGDDAAVDPDSAALLSEEFCRKRRAAPIGFDGNMLRLAVADPLDYSVLQDAEFKTGRRIKAVVVTESGLERMLGLLPRQAAPASVSYDLLAKVDPAGEIEPTVVQEHEIVDPATLIKDTNLPPIVRLVNLVLSEAAKSGASDIHIEPRESSMLVRQRVDGLLRDVLTIPRHLQDQVISRLKILSGMDIAERRKPQDGRSRLRFDGRRIDLRVSTLPTQFGEKIVIRLLNIDSAVLPLDQLGFSSDNLATLKSLLARPQGMILVTGPTGSGKTSTLYAALNAIKSPTNNIITLEDPIEFQLPGVNQVQLNTRAGMTFAAGLRSILRQDPNVILVGEIRDQETADVALRAAQTGHLLLSTLHTNDAPSTITRLFDLGIPPFLVASSLIGVVAQRLVRRPCRSCVTKRRPEQGVADRLGGWTRLPADGQWVAGQGCDECGQTGFKGRLAIHEILPVTDEVRALISSQAPDHALRQAARRAGMRTLSEDGVDKAAQGLTTLDSVLSVAHDEAGAHTEPAAAQPAVARPAVVSASAGVAAEVPASDTGRRRVLIVEDSPTVASVVRYFLELEGFTVLVAEDGRQGLEMALRERPDIIVSDVNMPCMGGLEMVKALRTDTRGANIRVLMLTSESSVESEALGLEAGADDYILKPVEPKRLAARVKALLARSRAGTVHQTA